MKNYIRGVVLIALGLGCDGPAPPVPAVAGVNLNVRLGDRAEAVLSRRPEARYIPYAGWYEDLSSRTPFSQVGYRFEEGGAPDREHRRGRLRQVVLVVDSAVHADSLIAMLDAHFGSHSFLGCSELPDSRDEVALLGWNASTDYRVLVSLPMRDGRPPRLEGVANVHIALPGIEIPQLSGLPTRPNGCFTDKLF